MRVPVGHGGDEITHLSEKFNEMAARLAATEERERQFLMSVSHELRTPLTAIKGHVDAIRDGLFDDPELERASLDVVAGETIRLERLVGDVLDLAKLNAHRFTVYPQEVDMAVLVERAHASFGEEARRREIDFRLDEDPETPTIVTDGDRVLQVITNLLANAFRWTPDGGTVQLASELVDGFVRVDVSDTGPGHPGPRSRSGSSSRSSRATTTARASASRSPASSRMRSAAASSSSRRSGRAAASRSSCRRPSRPRAHAGRVAADLSEVRLSGCPGRTQESG